MTAIIGNCNDCSAHAIAIAIRERSLMRRLAIVTESGTEKRTATVTLMRCSKSLRHYVELVQVGERVMFLQHVKLKHRCAVEL